MLEHYTLHHTTIQKEYANMCVYVYMCIAHVDAEGSWMPGMMICITKRIHTCSGCMYLILSLRHFTAVNIKVHIKCAMCKRANGQQHRGVQDCRVGSHYIHSFRYATVISTFTSITYCSQVESMNSVLECTKWIPLFGGMENIPTQKVCLCMQVVLYDKLQCTVTSA